MRTYAASLTALLSIACSIAEAKKRVTDLTRSTIAGFLEQNAAGIQKTIDHANRYGKQIAGLAEGPFIPCMGSGPDQITASFTGAKIFEAGGVYASGHDLEEWSLRESFICSPDYAVLVFASPGPTFNRAVAVSGAAKAAGHRVLAVCPNGIHDFDSIAHRVLPVFGAWHPLLSPFAQYLPGVLLACHLGIKLNRPLAIGRAG
jgi:glucosamine 6-phosphate synthetase-like amidotransferase/phosphosugar isomerase protein